jgi:hypothetical protein
MIPCVRFHDLAFLFRGTQDEALNQRTIFSACSGKILASCRTAIAVLFLAGISLSFDEPLRYPQGSQWVAMTYVMWTVVMLAVAWIDWWLDSRLAALAQAVDLLALAGALYVAIRPHGALNGPFLAFATFLLIVALARWGTFGVAVSSLFLILAATAPALLLSALATGPDPMHFLRGLGCIVLVSALVLWLASQQRGMRVVTLTEPAGAPGNRRSRVLSGALDEACAIMRARGAALVVSWGDEPWIDVLVTREGIATSERLGPGLMAEALSSPVPPTMFNLPRHRRIALIGEYRLEASREAFSVPLADFLEVDEGIMAAFNSVSSQGHLLVWGFRAWRSTIWRGWPRWRGNRPGARPRGDGLACQEFGGDRSAQCPGARPSRQRRPVSGRYDVWARSPAPAPARRHRPGRRNRGDEGIPAARAGPAAGDDRPPAAWRGWRPHRRSGRGTARARR